MADKHFQDFDLVAESGGDPDIAFAMLCSRGCSEEDARQMIEAMGMGRNRSQPAGTPHTSNNSETAETAQEEQVLVSREHSFDGLAKRWPPMDALMASEPGLEGRDFDARTEGACACFYRVTSRSPAKLVLLS
jgi:hypothetical protein